MSNDYERIEKMILASRQFDGTTERMFNELFGTMYHIAVELADLEVAAGKMPVLASALADTVALFQNMVSALPEEARKALTGLLEAIVTAKAQQVIAALEEDIKKNPDNPDVKEAMSVVGRVIDKLGAHPEKLAKAEKPVVEPVTEKKSSAAVDFWK